MKTLLLALLSAISLHAENVFDGKSLTGWRIDGAEYWTAKDNILTGQSDEAKKGSILWTEKSYGDFEVELEYRSTGSIDSGVFLRHPNDQIQIGVSGSLKRDMTASPYIVKKGYPKEATGVAELLKDGDWNHLKITVKGPVYTIFLNGKQVVEYTSETAIEKGPIGLQVHPNVLMKIDFRNVKITELKS